MSVKPTMDLGLQPVTNRFVKDKGGTEYKHQLILGLCSTCGLLQLLESFPSEELEPRYDWIKYREPEQHLDKVAVELAALPSINKSSAIFGVSSKDDSLLDRMNKLGFSKTYRLDMEKDLGVCGNYGIETIQHKLDSSIASTIAEKHGKFDLIIARHIVEHAENFSMFLSGLKSLLKDEGYIMFESPDCSKQLKMLDYSMPWEEHTIYFTQTTMKNSFSHEKLKVINFCSYNHSIEDSLVLIVKLDNSILPILPGKKILNSETEVVREYSNGLVHKQEITRKFLSDFRKHKGPVAVFGAGHNASMIINILELVDCVDYVIDDNPSKQGLFMPGSQIPIFGSSVLLDKGISICILSISPDIEDNIIAKNNNFLNKGGLFASFCHLSRHSLYKLIEEGKNLC